MRISREHSSAWVAALAIFDLLAILAAYTFSTFVSLRTGETFSGQAQANISYLLVMTGIWTYQAIEQRLFISMRSDALMPELFAVTKAAVITMLLTVFSLALLIQASLDRSLIIIFCLTTFLTIVIVRTALRLSLWGFRRRGYNYLRILVIGSNERAAHVVRVIQSHEHFGFQVDGFLETDDSRRQHLEKLGIEFLGGIRELESVLVNRVVDVVYICLPMRSHHETIQSIAHLCEGVGVPVRLRADLFPVKVASGELVRVGPFPMLSLTSTGLLRTPLRVQRLTDALVAALLFITLIPVFTIIGVLIKIESRGPVFVSETRGDSSGRKKVALVRFRTSRTSPREKNEITRFGKFLVTYHLDELPTLINIGRGQLSLSDPLMRHSDDAHSDQNTKLSRAAETSQPSG